LVGDKDSINEDSGLGPEERYTLLVDHAPEAIVVLDPDSGRFVDCNRRACELYEAPRDVLLNLGPVMLSPERQPDLRPSPQAAMGYIKACIEKGVEVCFEWMHKTRSGKLVSCEVTLVRLRHGERFLVVGAIKDLTETKRREADRLEFETNLQHAQKLESLGVMAGGIAHDFNNLLVSILGNTDLALLDLDSDHPAFERVQRIQRASIQATELTNQLLAYTGRSPITVKRIDVNAIVRELTELMDVAVSKRANVELRDTRERLTIQAEPTQLKQVIMNLITNAAEAIPADSDSGRIVITTGSRTMVQGDTTNPHLGAAQLTAGDYAFVQVSDTGAGMDRETLERIFEPFFTTKVDGRGLGLAAVLGIIRGHGGDIEVKSVEGRGTTVTVFLPKAVERPVSRVKTLTPHPSWRGSGKVLVVDDEAPVRHVARAMLEELGFEVTEAADGRAGLEAYTSDPNAYCMVLLDMTMPNLNGAETLERLKRANKNLPVVLTSGFDQQDVTSRMRKYDHVLFLQKPFQLMALATAARQLLPSQRRRRK